MQPVRDPGIAMPAKIVSIAAIAPNKAVPVAFASNITQAKGSAVADPLFCSTSYKTTILFTNLSLVDLLTTTSMYTPACNPSITILSFL